MRKVKVLFFTADPRSAYEGEERLLLDENMRQILEKVSTADHRDALEFVFRPAARTDDLLQALNQVRPQVVHFSGHGENEGLVLVSADGLRSHLVAGEVLEQLFGQFRDDIRLVVLNACFSLSQAEAIAEAVGCAIGTRGGILDDAAIRFDAAFYRAVAFGHSVRTAYEQAVVALRMEHFGEENTPELVARDGVDPESIVLVDAFTVPAPHPRPGVPVCLSPNAERLFGRGAEIDRFVRRLAEPAEPAWAVRGLPGAGKTDFLRAIGCAPGTVEHFAGGVLYAELGQEADAVKVLRRWCIGLGMDPPKSKDADDFTEAIRRKLAGPALLVLDDVWDTTVAAAQTLADCRTPGCALLLSTRSPDIAGALAGSPDRAYRLQVLDDEPAVALLREHAPDAVAADPDGATELAASLGNLPLALKLAGHLVQKDDSSAPCRALLGTWRERLTELKGRERRPGMAAGELSLDAIISLSYDAMPDQETRQAAASLSVLGAAPYDFDRQAIDFAWAVEEHRATAWIESFVTSGLLERNPSTRRYSLHQTVHAFLEERCKAWTM
jgi:hypothetical protein